MQGTLNVGLRRTWQNKFKKIHHILAFSLSLSLTHMYMNVSPHCFYIFLPFDWDPVNYSLNKRCDFNTSHFLKGWHKEEVEAVGHGVGRWENAKVRNYILYATAERLSHSEHPYGRSTLPELF